MYRSCNFKATLESEAVVKLPTEINGYGVIDDHAFITRNFKLKNQEAQTSFLQILVSGEITLYRFENTFLLEKHNQKVYELNNDEKVVMIDQKQYFQRSNEYLGVFKVMMEDCPAVEKTYKKINLEEKPLVELIELYNRCNLKQPSLTNKSKKEWKIVTYELLLTMNRGTLVTPPSLLSISSSGEFTNVSAIGGSMGLDIKSPRISEFVSLSIAASYTATRFKNTTNFQNGTRVMEINGTYLIVPIGIRLHKPIRNLTPYLTIGLTPGVLLSDDSNQTSTGALGSLKTTLNYYNKNAYGYFGGLGITYKISEKTDGLVEIKFNRMKTSTLQYNIDRENKPFSNTILQISAGVKIK
jgi:hypothetical protein